MALEQLPGTIKKLSGKVKKKKLKKILDSENVKRISELRCSIWYKKATVKIFCNKNFLPSKIFIIKKIYCQKISASKIFCYLKKFL